MHIFESHRLTCRRWVIEDVESLYAVYSDPIAARWVDDGQPITREECNRWFKVTQENYKVRGYGMFTLDEKSSGATIGFIGLVHPDGQKEVEIKYSFLRSYWGQGLASEAVEALLVYATREHGIRFVIATVAPENLASQRVLTKCGMRLAEKRVNEDQSTTFVYKWHAQERKS